MVNHIREIILREKYSSHRELGHHAPCLLRHVSPGREFMKLSHNYTPGRMNIPTRYLACLILYGGLCEEIEASRSDNSIIQRHAGLKKTISKVSRNSLLVQLNDILTNNIFTDHNQNNTYLACLGEIIYNERNIRHIGSLGITPLAF